MNSEPIAWHCSHNILKKVVWTTSPTEAQTLRDAKDKHWTVAALVAPPRWIPVDESLPPQETPVLILLNGVPTIGEIVWEVPGYEDTFQAFKYWDSPQMDGQGWEWHEITHWMHLPPVEVAS